VEGLVEPSHQRPRRALRIEAEAMLADLERIYENDARALGWLELRLPTRVDMRGTVLIATHLYQARGAHHE
jgi:hypothetical protein